VLVLRSTTRLLGEVTKKKRDLQRNASAAPPSKKETELP